MNDELNAYTLNREAMETNKFDTKTDVWSFGVTMVRLATRYVCPCMVDLMMNTI